MQVIKHIIKNIIYRLLPRRIILRSGTELDTIYLTFDDGPYNEYTKIIVDGLRKHNVLATFFFNGDSIQNYIDLIAEIHRDGHDIGNHSYTHSKPYYWNVLREKKEIMKTNYIINQITNKPCCLYRPPYGILRIPNILSALINKLTIVLWSYESNDSFVDNYDEIEKTLQNIKAGDILLFHNDSEITARNISKIIENIQKRGLKFGLISDIVSA